MTKFSISRKNIIDFFMVKFGKKGAGLIPPESWFGAIWKQSSNWGTSGGFEAQRAVGRIPRHSAEPFGLSSGSKTHVEACESRKGHLGSSEAKGKWCSIIKKWSEIAFQGAKGDSGKNMTPFEAEYSVSAAKYFATG